MADGDGEVVGVVCGYASWGDGAGYAMVFPYRLAPIFTNTGEHRLHR